MTDDRLEKYIERDGCAYAERRGWKEYKVVSPSCKGFPDRFYCRRGRILLVEWKREGEDATRQQKRRHAELRAEGVEVYVIDNLDYAYALFE